MAKHNVAHAQSKRREEIRKLKQSGMTYQDISDMLGVSRQRAQQLVSPTNKERISIIEQHGNKCDRCNISQADVSRLELHHAEYGIDSKFEVLCPTCHSRADIDLGTRLSGESLKRDSLGKFTKIRSVVNG